MHVTPFLTVSPSFTTLSFWFLLACCYAVYFVVHRQVMLRNIFLLLISYGFAIVWDWHVPIVLCICTVTSYFLALLLHRTRSVRKKKFILSVSIIGYIGVLMYCKYMGFFLENLNVFLRSIGWPSVVWGMSIFLPLGLSFYTFSIISYLTDVYRGTQQPTKDFLAYALFLAYFAKYIAGPIERAGHLLPQFQNVQKISMQHISTGVMLIVWGLVQKVIIADNAAVYASYSLLTPGNISANSLTILLALPLQIYADFSGYSDIARGIASLFGFTLVKNFNLPYLALSPTDFWRRWHISLSQWCRDYIYIPLGGNRLGFLFTLRNLFLTMLVVGLWHGASWNFIAWGAYHGILSCLYLLAERYASPDAGYVKFFRIPLVSGMVWFGLVCISWIIFQTYSPEPFWHVLFLLRPTGGKFFLLTLLCWIPIFSIHAWAQYAKKRTRSASASPLLRMTFVLACLYVLIFLAPFRQFDFVYKQF